VRKTELGQWIFNFAVLGTLVAAFAAVVWLFALAIREGSTVVAATLAGFATVAAAVIVRYFERRKELEATRRQHMGPLYEQLASALAGHEFTQRKLEKVVTDFTRKSLVYASPAVLKAFREWRQALPDDYEAWPRHAQRANALRYEAFVKAMRKDLGVSNWMLQEGDLGRTVLSDFDEYFGDGRPESLAPPEPPGAPQVFGRGARSSPRAGIPPKSVR
jgi:hypothetical protein